MGEEKKPIEHRGSESEAKAKPEAVERGVKPCAWTMQEIMDALPLTADGKAIIPGMTVFCVAGNYADERKVIGPYGKKALLTSEPARHGTCAGSSHRLADTVYAVRENAIEATKV